MSLQNLCLDTIVENFERYFSAYSTSDDVNLKRKFEFLQRIYSQEIATKLFEEFEIEEKHADFVINKYLKSLDTKWFGNCSWKAVIAKMAEIGPEIKKISFFGRSKTWPWHEIICYLPNLEVMHYRDCVDEVLKGIAEYCPNIQEIKIGLYTNITEEGFKSLCKVKNGNTSCSKLKRFLIDGRYIPEDAAKYLVQNLPSLEDFRYIFLHSVLYALHHKDLPTIDKVTPYKLTWLEISSSSYPCYDDVLKLCFTLCPNLKSLVCPVMKPQQLNLVSELSSLEKLDIDYCSNDNFLDLNDFLKLKGSKLTSLHLEKCLVSLSTLTKNCPNVKKLIIFNVNVECDKTSIPPFKHLEVLTIGISGLSVIEENLKSACLILSASPKLESMSFVKCNLTQSEIKTTILKCCELSLIKKINFHCSVVEKQFILDILFTCHSLSVFELLPNNPKIFFTEEMSVSDDDDGDIFSNYSDHDTSNSEYEIDSDLYDVELYI